MLRRGRGRSLFSSLAADAERQGEAIRSHWGVENSHHWAMDMLFRDDECPIRTANAATNFATIKHMAGNLLRRGAGKQSLRVKRRLAAWDDHLPSRLPGRTKPCPRCGGRGWIRPVEKRIVRLPAGRRE